MVRKPSSITRVGIVQTILASSFVIWLIFFPSRGVDFAWPIFPKESAMFIGTAFIIRAYLGYHLWRQTEWHKLRWQVWGNYGFLAIILLATFWHIDEMNWSSNIWVAHIWVVAYIVEPLTLPLLEPRGSQAKAPLPAELRQGPVLPAFRNVMMVGFVVGMALGLLLFINPEFMTTRWPWPLDPFDSRIMGAFPVMAALWSLYGYLGDDWAEVKPGIVGILILNVGLFLGWVYNYSRLDQSRENVIEYGVITGLMVLIGGYFYYRQEQATPAAIAESTS